MVKVVCFSLQLVESVGNPAMSSAMVLDHFKAVVVPEIRQRQVQRSDRNKTIAELLENLSAVAPVHMV